MMNRKQRNALFFMVLMGTVLVGATPLSIESRSTLSTRPSSDVSFPKFYFQREVALNCSIDGNSDLYGIGVRSGIYLQAWASMFTLAFGFDKAANALSTNIWFQIALFIALLYTSAMKTIYASEAVIAMLLLALLQIFDAMLICSTAIHLVSAHSLRTRSRPPEIVELKRNNTITGLQEGETGGEGGIGHLQRDCEHREGTESSSPNPAIRNGEIALTDLDTPVARQRSRKLRAARRDRREPPDFSGDLFQLVKEDFKDEAELASIIETWVYYMSNGNLFSCCLVAVLILAGVIYATWFWWVGMFNLQPSPCESHAVFLGIPLDIFGWVRWPTRVFLIIALFIFGCLYLLWIPVIILVEVLISEIIFYRCGGTFGCRLERQYPVLRLRRTFYNRIIEAELVPKTKFIGSLLMLAALLIAQLNDLLGTRDTDTQIGSCTEVAREGEPNLIRAPPNDSYTNPKFDGKTQNIAEVDITETRAMDDEITPMHDNVHSRQAPTVAAAGPESEHSLQCQLATTELRAADEDHTALIGVRRVPDSSTSRLSRLIDRVEDRIEAALSLPLEQAVPIPNDLPKANTQVQSHADSLHNEQQQQQQQQQQQSINTAKIPLRVFLAHAPIFPLFSFYFLFCVLSIELTIQANRLSGVNELPSASQLIPFIIGLASICQNGFALVVNVVGVVGAWMRAREKRGRDGEGGDVLGVGF